MARKNFVLMSWCLLISFFIVIGNGNLIHKTQKEKNLKIHGIDAEIYKSITEEVVYFPVVEFTNKNENLSYTDSFGTERTYGGTRTHEGCDIIPQKNQSDYYPIVSMTDGIVTQKGWLDKGGYRIGITSKKGFYYYYAHLSSYADVEIGDEIHAGDLLGYMGDTGYGPEGTKGQFVVHLHVGIYQIKDGNEESMNPYWILRNVENHRVKCYTEE